MEPDRVPLTDSSGRLVGRTTEAAALRRRAEAARGGQAHLVTLLGPPGAGRTSLLRSFVTGDDCRTMTVLHGACRRTESAVGYDGVRALFGAFDPDRDDDRAAPWWRDAARAALRTAATAAEGAAARGVLHGLYRLAQNLMAERPLVLALDDAHRCDAQSLAWIDFLLRRSHESPLLVVLTRSTEIEPAAPSELARISGYRPSATLRLAPLTRQDRAELVARAYGVPADSAFVHDVAALPTGNPRVFDALLTELKRAGVPPEASGAPAVREVAARLLSGTVRGILRGRPEWIRRLARVIAVLGPAPPRPARRHRRRAARPGRGGHRNPARRRDPRRGRHGPRPRPGAFRRAGGHGRRRRGRPARQGGTPSQ